MCRRDVLQRERRQERETDNYSKGHDKQRNEIVTFWPLLVEGEQKRQGHKASDGRASAGQEHRIEVGDRNSCRWQ